MLKTLLLIILFPLLTSCGFKPVYKTNYIINTKLSSIEIMPISSIEGTYFYNHLKSILPPSKEAKYVLSASLTFVKSYNIIQPNSDVLRETQNLTVTYKLIDKQSLKIIKEASFVKTSSYSVNSALYANTVLRQESVDILAESGAEEVRNRLIMFFSNASDKSE